MLAVAVPELDPTGIAVEVHLRALDTTEQVPMPLREMAT
jgi:hypothetical protein